jgi:hypothetical protein
MENDPFKLYFPSGSQTARDRVRINQLYPDTPDRSNYSPFIQKTYPLFFRIVFVVSASRAVGHDSKSTTTFKPIHSTYE